ncbi:MAG: DNA-processing protein DprA [Planctomycetota bacterium]
MTENELTDAESVCDLSTLALTLVPGVGPRLLTGLLDVFDTAEEVLKASDKQLRSVDGVGAKLAEGIAVARSLQTARQVQSWCQRNDVRILLRHAADYPDRLHDLHDTPPLLFVRGELEQQDQIGVAIVGTRHATQYGLRQARLYAGALARCGVTIISGMARGIDAAAHEAAMDAGGRTIAVMGCGLATIYPPEHEGLSSAIAAHGALISEYSPMVKPRAPLFPQRNRIVSGLSMAVLVVEAPERSGALITARQAGEQGREVMAIPGAITSRSSRGCNALIRDGATLVQSVDHVLECLGPVARPIDLDDGGQLHSGAEIQLNEQEQRVLRAIEPTSTSIDSVCRACDLPIQRVLATISVLENRRLVRRLSGQYVSRI